MHGQPKVHWDDGSKGKWNKERTSATYVWPTIIELSMRLDRQRPCYWHFALTWNW